MGKKRIIVLMGGKTPEHEVSLASGSQVVQYLDRSRFEILPVVISKDGRRWSLKTREEVLLYSSNLLKESGSKSSLSGKKTVKTGAILFPEMIPQRADLVFITMHGPFGEDGTIQGLLELTGIPYTGSGVLASALKMDKPMFRKIMKAEGIKSPKYLVFTKGGDQNCIWRKLKPPVIVKPSSQGSSLGVSLVCQKKQLGSALIKAFSFGQRVIIEEYLKGVEITCGVLGNKDPRALPPVEIIPKNEFFDYGSKYNPGMSEEICPARISPLMTKKVQDLAVKVFKSIGARGFGRVDMILVGGQLYVLEINTIPGLTSNSLLPKEAQAAGLSFSQLLEKIVDLALEK